MQTTNQLEVKNLIGNLAVIPSPFYLIFEVLQWEMPFLRKIESFKNGQYIGRPNLALLKKGYYDGVELVMWGLFNENWEINTKRLEKYQKCGIPFYTFHGCYEAFPKKFKNTYLNLAEKNEKIKKAIKAHIDVASMLKRGNQTILVFHPGKIINCSKTEAIKNIINNLAPFLDYAKQKNVVITLENMPYYKNRPDFFNFAEDFQYVFKEISHPNLKITFDWGHLNTQNLRYQNQKSKNIFYKIEEFINTLGEHIAHAHIHYNQSHFQNPMNLKMGIIKKFIVKYLRKTNDKNLSIESAFIESLDQHLALNKIEEEYYDAYAETIINLLKKTKILTYGYITHEIAPRRIFKFFTFQQNGANFEDYLESLDIFKKIINRLCTK